MTKPIAERVAKRARRPRVTMAGTLSAAILAASAASQRIAWPSERYQAAPGRFFREVLGVEPWHKQDEVLEALVPERARVSVKSGHKVGKSSLGAGAALWFYCSFLDARVIMSSVTDRQVNQILWRELRMLHARARHPIDGHLHELARTGFRSADFREVVGFTAKEAEAVAGISGRNLLYILDEASGIPDAIYEAVEGNRAGGARVLMLGNPTRVEGEFFRSHSDKREFYRTFTISSEESPNVREGRAVIPGLATREWVEEKRQEWGEESALFQVRVRGNFARQDASTVIPLYLVDEAEERWHEVAAEGRLHVGVDVARFGDDDSVAIPRRGCKALEVVAWHGLDEQTLAAQVVQVVRRHRSPREQKAAVKVDACGGIGIRVVGHLHAYQEEIEVIPVNVAERSRLPGEFPLLRDQLWFALRDWLKDGGAIPEDAKLAAELVAPRFEFDLRQRRKVESKDELRKRLKRSPDRADALALCAWEPLVFQPPAEDEDFSREDDRAHAFDAYGGSGFDAYASIGGLGGWR
ncbi:hypothetical protein [Chondromyces apiculatus]|uniref:Uncharacterized protein n=1 Tax=Chondromyces apiculatus DSM 436 TaxID=1192034 RepID=A0A017STV2_9BACT|nr:hypothetical protein [Chondromyces apiculatus]EYF00197.1 Hypothetical protein CAP_1091 [Chondromyces apiculatus DSM 436]